MAAAFCYPKSGTELSQLTHERSRSWRQGANGDILDIYIDLIPDDEYAARQQEIARLDQHLAEVLGGARK